MSALRRGQQPPRIVIEAFLLASNCGGLWRCSYIGRVGHTFKAHWTCPSCQCLVVSPLPAPEPLRLHLAYAGGVSSSASSITAPFAVQYHDIESLQIVRRRRKAPLRTALRHHLANHPSRNNQGARRNQLSRRPTPLHKMVQQTQNPPKTRERPIDRRLQGRRQKYQQLNMMQNRHLIRRPSNSESRWRGSTMRPVRSRRQGGSRVV